MSSDCIHRLVICLGCGDAIKRCACPEPAGLRGYNWCGKEEKCVRPEGFSEEPLEEPPLPEKRTKEMVPLAESVSFIFSTEEPAQFAGWLRAVADLSERCPLVELIARPAKEKKDPPK